MPPKKNHTQSRSETSENDQFELILVRLSNVDKHLEEIKCDNKTLKEKLSEIQKDNSKLLDRTNTLERSRDMQDHEIENLKTEKS